MQITNGTVSRTVKPADYEGRTVTLAFTVDPGDDVELALQHVGFLAEKYARQTPPVQAETAVPAQVAAAAPAPPTVEPAAATRGRRNARPPVVESTARVEPEAQAEPAASVAPAPTPAPSAAPTSVVPAPAAASGSSAAPLASAVSDGEITTEELNRAIGLARKIWQVSAEIVTALRDAATGTPGMSLFAPEATQEMKRRFLEELNKHNPNNAAGEQY